MVKFESPTIVQRKLKAEVDKNAPKKDCIIANFVKLVRSKNWKRSGRSSTITEEKIDEVHHVVEDQQRTDVRTVARACPSFRTTAHQIITK